MMHAQARGDVSSPFLFPVLLFPLFLFIPRILKIYDYGQSIPATRYHFMKQLCGYVTPPSSSQSSSSGLAGQGASAAEGSTSDARKG